MLGTQGLKGKLKTIDNPVVDAYIKYLKEGTDYQHVMQRESRQARLMLRKAAKQRAIERLQTQEQRGLVWDDPAITKSIERNTVQLAKPAPLNK